MRRIITCLTLLVVTLAAAKDGGGEFTIEEPAKNENYAPSMIFHASGSRNVMTDVKLLLRIWNPDELKWEAIQASTAVMPGGQMSTSWADPNPQGIVPPSNGWTPSSATVEWRAILFSCDGGGGSLEDKEINVYTIHVPGQP